MVVNSGQGVLTFKFLAAPREFIFYMQIKRLKEQVILALSKTFNKTLKDSL